MKHAPKTICRDNNYVEGGGGVTQLNFHSHISVVSRLESAVFGDCSKGTMKSSSGVQM